MRSDLRPYKRITLQTSAFLVASFALGIVSLKIGRVNGFDVAPSQTSNRVVKEISNLKAEEFLELNNIVIVDARTLLEFKKSHIRGAISIPAEEFDIALSRHLELFTSKKQIMIYCNNAGCTLSDLVARRLNSLGLSNISVLSNGWDGWKNASLPVEKGGDSD